MKISTNALACFTALFFYLFVSTCAAAAPGVDRSTAMARTLSYNGPLQFEPNRGQFNQEIRFRARLQSFVADLHPDSIALRFRADHRSSLTRLSPVILRWQGGNAGTIAVPEGEPSSRTSYFLSRPSHTWKTAVPTYDRVRYQEIYSGIDLVVYGKPDHLEYDFVISPEGHPEDIRIAFEQVESLRLEPEGSLILEASHGTLRQLSPRIFQTTSEGRQEIEGRYRLLAEKVVGIEVAHYDPSLPLTIDPVIIYSSYLGGSRGDVPGGVAVDAEGHLYIMGSTGSEDFPLFEPFQSEFAGGGATDGDLFLTKLDPSGQKVLYSTYIGGEGTDIGEGIAVDDQGRAYVAGTTFSEDFPSTPGAFQEECSGQCPFVVRLSSAGDSLEYATFLGRGFGLGVAVDDQWEAVLVGTTTAADFPTRSAFQPAGAGGRDAYVTRFNSDGSDLVFSSFLGGSDDESLGSQMDVALDSQSHALIVGSTRSEDFPTSHSILNSLQGGDDVFLTKISPTGQIVHSTYLGGEEDDDGWAVASDSADNIYVSGETRSADFPTAAAFQEEFGGGSFGDAFLSKIPPAGGSLLFSTFLGGDGADQGADLSVDELDRAVLVGSAAAGFPLQNSLFPLEGIDNFLLKMESDGSSLFYSTAFRGGDDDISVTTRGTDVYLAGNSGSGRDPILHALQIRRAGSTETIFAQISDAGELYFAQFGNGPGAVSEILLTNSSTETPSNAVLAFRDDDGMPVELNLTVSDTAEGAAVVQQATSELAVTVEPLGVVKVTTDGQGEDLVAGSVAVTHDMPLGGVLRFNLTPFGTAGVGVSELVRGFITPARRMSIRTGVAIFNPEESQTGLTMRLRDRAGDPIPGGLFTTALPPKGHLAKFIDELFGSADLENFEGTLTVEASGQALIAATALELGPQAGQFTTLPITPLP